MVTTVPGLRGSGDFTTDFRPTNYRELYTFLEPNGDAPINALLAMMNSESTDDPKFNNFRDELPARVMTVSAITTPASSTSITIGTANDAGWVTTGVILVNASTGEVMRATADGNTSTGVITVTRNVGGTSLSTAVADKLFVAGFAADEGGQAPTPVTFDPTVSYNYTQIFKKSFSLTGTLKHTATRANVGTEDDYRMKALKLHMQDIERAMLFSRRSETTGANGQKLRTTGGLLNTLTQVVDVSAAPYSGVMSEALFDRALIDTVFAYGGKTKVAYVGPTIAGHLQAIGKNRWQPTTIDSGAYGISFTRYKTFAGDLLVYLHPQFRMLTHMAKSMLILDPEYMKYRYLDGRDTQLLENIQLPDEDGVKHQYMTDCGLELLQDKVHTYLSGWTSLT